LAFTHDQQYGEQYYSFVNGQNTTQGGTHLNAFKEAFVNTIRDHYKKSYDAKDIRASITAAISVKVEEPVFESQTKTKLGSQSIGPKGPTIRTFINNFLSENWVITLSKTQKLQMLFRKELSNLNVSEKKLQALKN
jgi:Type IIA topoisomerase (DNA gyrase/topo II, topoisomerase IV), B subunit